MEVEEGAEADLNEIDDEPSSQQQQQDGSGGATLGRGLGRAVGAKMVAEGVEDVGGCEERAAARRVRPVQRLRLQSL